MATLLSKIATYQKTWNPFAFEFLLYVRDGKVFRRLLSTIPSGAKILDIGCGDGRYWLHRPDLEWVGLDINPHSRGHIIISPNSRFPLVDEEVDAVLLSFSIEHISNLELLTSEIYRVLAKGGKVIVRAPFLYPLHDTPEDYYRFSPEGLSQQFERFEES